MDIVQITGLQKNFGDKEVLTGVDLNIPEHSIFGFIGKNGSGKTTTMKILLGLMKADGGKITVCGEPVVYGQTPTNRHIGYLPDVPEFYPYMTASEYLRFCGEITGMESQDLEPRILELLTLVHLENETHKIRGFSRGMKQRLGIAQALLNRPKLLICDEPTSALDPVGRKEILDILSSVRAETTVVFSTHILSDVERICTDVAFLNNGTIRIQGKLSDVKSAYRAEAYVLVPEDPAQCTDLMNTFPKMHRISEFVLTFRVEDHPLANILRYLADSQIALTRLERIEPTLETLFMEVVEQ